MPSSVNDFRFPERPAWCPKCWYERVSSGALRVNEFMELTEWAGALYEGVDKEELKDFVTAVEKTCSRPGASNQ